LPVHANGPRDWDERFLDFDGTITQQRWIDMAREWASFIHSHLKSPEHFELQISARKKAVL
jgi:hypothetical protein